MTQRGSRRSASAGTRDVPGWGPVARACAALLEQVDPLSDRIAARITEEVEEYRQFPRDQVRALIVAIGQAAVVGLAERRPPTEEEKRVAFVLGEQRATAGFTVESIISAFQVGFREWMTEIFPLIPARDRHLLLDATRTMWTWLHEMGEAVRQGHSAEARRQQAATAQIGQRFLDGLRRGDVAAEEVRQLSRRLGFDPTGTFRVAWMRALTDHQLTGSLVEQADGVGHAFDYGLDLVVVTQGVDADHLEAILERSYGTLGIGLERPGLEGARASMVDAELSVNLAEAVRAPVVRFEHDWLRAVLYDRREHLAPLLESGIATCRKHPHLAEAALQFGAARFSQTETARRLHLRPNSLNYRLKRWEERTGRELRNSEGLAYAALAAICAGE